MGRRRKQYHRRNKRQSRKVKDSLCAPSLPLPFGVVVDLASFKRILLHDNEQNLEGDEYQMCQKISELDSDMQIFDSLDKCIAYAQQEYIKNLYVLVWQIDYLSIKDIRQTIIRKCSSFGLRRLYVLKGCQIHSRNEEIYIRVIFDDKHCNKSEQKDVELDPLVPMSVFDLTHGKDMSIRDLNDDQVRFIWFQLLLDVLLRMPRSTNNMTDMLEVARSYYRSDPIELKKINEFASTYQPSKAIWWYTHDSFVYRLLNRAFRTQDICTIFTFRFFILDLYTQLSGIAKARAVPLRKEAYRGQFLPMNELEAIKNNVNGLISMNTFLSTTTDASVAFLYAGHGSGLPSHASVVFTIDLNIDNNDNSTAFDRPFADISQYSSKLDEKEILFSMGTIFRITAVEEYDSTYEVFLQRETQAKECLSTLISHESIELTQSTTSELALGDFLSAMGMLDQAEQFYRIILQYQIPADENPELHVSLFNSIGLLHINRADYSAAQSVLEQAYSVAKNSRVFLSTTLSNLGLVYLNQCRYDRALKYFQRAKRLEPSTKKSISILSNIAAVFEEKGQYKKARSYYRRTLTTQEKYLPPMHLEFAKLYLNLGSLEKTLGNYQKSLTLYEKSLNIYQLTLPANHHSLAHIYNNLGLLHQELKSFSKAREYLEQALHILSLNFERTKDQNLLYMKTLNNLGTLQFEQQDFSGAEVSFQHTLDLKLRLTGTDPNSHQSYAISYNNIAMVQLKQGRFKQALANFKRTLRIERLHGNPADIATSYNNIAGIYHEMNQLIKAKRFYKKARLNALIVFHKDHPAVKLYQDNLKKAIKKLKRLRRSQATENKHE
ncbi:unnamed protein product [Adineta ricciae]|uniref:Uncharacterized protein n=1 Tax=Adineta ricciae TaxID=249248 RepID=A0A816EID5_ADIRI|nr:unnamed protein product [Adineta ricciae]CAF1650087.1 unnamed protein product [Adineta ricciae]